MSLEPNLAALVAASTQLTKSIAMPLSVVTGKRDAATTAEADITSAESAIATAATTATTDAATTASKLTAAAADYAAQKTTKGLAAVQTSADTELKDRLHRRDPARHPFRGARPSLVMDFVRRECHRNNAAGNLEPVDLNSFMTFTRASTATYVGPDGLIKEAASNVPRYGYDPVTGEALGLLIEEQRTNLLSGSVERLYLWDLARVDPIRSTILSPGGKLDAFKLTERQVSPAPEYYMRSMTGTNGSAGQTFCASVYVHTSSDRVPRLRVTHTSCAPQTTEVTFNISQRTFSSPSGYITSTGFADAGNGWLRIWVVYTLPTASVTEWGLNLQGGTTTGDGVSGVLIYGPQLEIGSFPTSYIPTPATFTGRASTKTYFDSNGVLQTAASGVAVTDHGYVDGRWVSKGLSLEGQATNLLTYSSDLSNGSLWKTNSATISGSTISFVGVMSRVVKPVTPADGIYTLSARFSLADVGKKIKLAVWYAGKDGFSYADSTIPESGVVTTTVNATGITSVGIINSSAGTAQSVTLYPGTGIQFEAGPVATSYIPTTTAQVTRAADTSTSAQVTRAADVATVAGANFTSGWYTPDGWTLGAQFSLSSSAPMGDRGVFGFHTATGLRGISLRTYIVSGNSAFVVRDAASNMNPVEGAPANTAGGRYSAGCGIATDGAARYTLNNSALVKQDVGFVRPAITNLAIGFNNAAGGPGYLNGYIRQLTYFPRQLSDADLQALTILED